jgi:hypothetical protein
MHTTIGIGDNADEFRRLIAHEQKKAAAFKAAGRPKKQIDLALRCVELYQARLNRFLMEAAA